MPILANMKRIVIIVILLGLLALSLMYLRPYLKPSQPTRAEQLQNEERLRPSKRLKGIFDGMSGGFNKP